MALKKPWRSTDLLETETQLDQANRIFRASQNPFYKHTRAGVTQGDAASLFWLEVGSQLVESSPTFIIITKTGNGLFYARGNQVENLGSKSGGLSDSIFNFHQQTVPLAERVALQLMSEELAPTEKCVPVVVIDDAREGDDILAYWLDTDVIMWDNAN